MPELKKRMGEKVHTRKIDIATYVADENSIIVEGRLIDDRLKSHYTLLNNKCPPMIIHHMVIRMLIDSSTLEIKEVEAEMPQIPEEECPKTLESLQKIKGMKISGGFTIKVKKMLGGVRGCSHLTTLLLTMAPAIMQGNFSNLARKPFPDDFTADVIKQFIGNTCMVWREDGPLMKEIEDALKKK